MNTKQEQLELGKMVQDRRDVKMRLACTKNKLKRYRKTLEQTAFVMNGKGVDTMSGFRFSDDSDEFRVLLVPVPGLHTFEKDFEKDRRFPTRGEIGQALKDLIYLQNRLSELDKILS